MKGLLMNKGNHKIQWPALVSAAILMTFTNMALAEIVVKPEEGDSFTVKNTLNSGQTRVTKLTQTNDTEGVIEEVVILGTRVAGRVSTDLPVAVDAFSRDDLAATGQTEVGRMLQKLAPSFNFSSSSISDGTDALRPATLRGLGPDQTLVLVNGKRRHQA
jgi:outer membrane receptor for ferrienterochelin and colicin